MGKTYDLNEDLKPRIEGRVRWEHAEPEPMLSAVNSITMGGHKLTYAGWFAKPGEEHKSYARYFLTTNQGGGHTGEALVFVYGGGGFHDRSEPERWFGKRPEAFRVAICKHEMQGTGTQEQANRGWHPGACRLCGMDMSVDSGD